MTYTTKRQLIHCLPSPSFNTIFPLYINIHQRIDGFAKVESLILLFLTTSYCDCFDFNLSKVGDGCIDGIAFLFKIILNLTSLDAATTGGTRKSTSVKWSEQMCKVLRSLISCLVSPTKLNHLNHFFSISGSFGAWWKLMLSVLGFEQKSKEQLSINQSINQILFMTKEINTTSSRYVT